MKRAIVEIQQLPGALDCLVGKGGVVDGVHPVNVPDAPLPQVAQCGVVAEEVVAHGTHAPLDRPGRCVPAQLFLTR